MNDRKIILGFETPTDEAHDTRIIHMTMSELRREVAARFEAIIDGTENSGPLKGLWDAVDYGECGNFWVSDAATDEIQLQCSGCSGRPSFLYGERPVFVLLDWTRTQETAGATR